MGVGRWMAMGGLLGLLAVGVACSPDRNGGKVPRGTPDCVSTCEAGWPCGGVLGNDLDTCLALCDDEVHGDYRVCIHQTECDTMHTCKVYGPSEAGPEDTDS